MEEENVKIREEIRELVAAVRGWKGEEEGGFGEMKDNLRRAERNAGKRNPREKMKTRNRKLRK